MKSSFTDFLLCGGVLSLIVALAWLIVGVGISPYSQVLFGDYYVIVNVLLFMLAYGIVSGLVLQLMLKIKPLPCGEFSMDSPVFTYWKLLSVVFLPFCPLRNSVSKTAYFLSIIPKFIIK